MKKIFLTLILLVQTTLLANTDPLYEIRGDSALLDANLTRFLHQWREETTRPIAEGNYTNIYLHGNTSQGKKIALTFDDSPDENNTDQVLDILKRYDIKASFFMIGAPMADLNTTSAKRAADEGHLVLNHSFNHPHFTHISDEEIIQEVRSASEKIENITGHYPLLLRPPYGSINQRVIDTLNAQGYKSILWSLDSLDWAIKDKNAILDNIMSHIQPGDIILMHSSRANNATVEALGEIIEKLREQGYQFQRVDEMLGIKAYR